MKAHDATSHAHVLTREQIERIRDDRYPMGRLATMSGIAGADEFIKELCERALASIPSEIPRNTEQDTYLGALISEYANVNFDAGAWDEDSDVSYDAVNEKCHEAKRKLLEEIARIRTSAPSATPRSDLVEACRGLIHYWTRNLNNFQWEKADTHVKRINAALPETPRD